MAITENKNQFLLEKVDEMLVKELICRMKCGTKSGGKKPVKK